MFIPPGYMQINLRFTRVGDPEPMLTSMAALIEAFDPVTGPDDLSAAVGTSDMMGITTNDTSYVGLECVIGTGDPSEPITLESIQNTGTGSSTNPPLPENCALLVKKVTLRGGRKGRGRCYWPDVQIAHVGDAGGITGSDLTAYQTAWDDLITAIEGVDGITSLVLLHSADEDGDPDVITSWIVQNKIATQRRRLRP